MNIKNVAIIGTGAVGSYILWGLLNKSDINVCVIAKDERKERYEGEGFVINDKVYHPVVKTPKEADDIDLLIVATKYNSLENALEDIKEVVNDNTIVMSLMNGVDSEEIISKVVNPKQIVYSLIKIASERKGNGVRFNPETTLGVIMGEKDLAVGNERIDAISQLFDGSGINYQTTEVILSEIWSKFRLNVSQNLPQAIIGCGVGIYDDSEHAAFIRKKLREEVESIAVAKGVDMSLLGETSVKGTKVLPRARYSTLQDLDAKRHTEVDMFAGAVVRMGKELGVETPYAEYTYHLIKAFEEKNDGKFNYE